MSTYHSARLLPSIFNHDHYRSILSLWFAGVPRNAGGPSVEATKRWFGGLDAQFQDEIDESCRRISMVALASLDPQNMPLAPFLDVETDKRNAASIARPLKDAFFEATRSKEASGPMLEADENAILDRSDVALALVLLLDQMPRNVYRKHEEQPLVYSHYDRLARTFVRSVVLEPAEAGTMDSSNISPIDREDLIKLDLARRFWFYLPLEHSEDIKDLDLFETLIADIEEPLTKRGDVSSLEYFRQFVDLHKRHRVIIERFGRYNYRNESLGRESTVEEQKWLDEGGDRFGR